MFVLGVCAVVAVAVFRFHWLRIAACAIGLIVWGVGNVALPHYFAFDALLHGDVAQALIPYAFGGGSGVLWLVAATAAFAWMRREGTTGNLWRDWYAH
jgi:hypothetical protein